MDKQKSTDRARRGAASVASDGSRKAPMAPNTRPAGADAIPTGGLLALTILALFGLAAACGKNGKTDSSAQTADGSVCTLPEEPQPDSGATKTDPTSGAFGANCLSADSCDSKVCIMGANNSGGCSKPCTARADCPDSADWSCGQVQGESVCVCTHDPELTEVCDGVDNDYDGLVDEGNHGADLCLAAEVCESGQCACPPDRACGDACVDKSQDNTNCGGCGNACTASPGTLTGCVSGNCSTIVIVAKEASFAHHLTVAQGYLYWATDNAVRRVALPGTTPETVIDGQGGLSALAADASHVCWTQAGTGAADGRVSCSTATGSAVALADSETAPIAIAIDGDRAFWTTSAAASVDPRFAAVDGTSEATTLASSDGEGGEWVGILGDRAYWLGSQGVWSVAKTGGQPEVVVPGQATDGDLNGAFALDGADLYFPRTGTGYVWRVALPSGEPTQFAKPIEWVTSIAVDATHSYWIDDDQKPHGVRAARKDCPLVEVVATGSTLPEEWSTESGAGTVSIATDGARVYWSAQGGYVLSIKAR